MTVAAAIKAVTAPAVVKEIKDSWAVMAGDKKTHGVNLMLKLFAMHPETVKHFKRLGDVSPANAWNNRKLIGHGTTLMYGIQSFVEQLDDPDTMEDVARKFAVNHNGRGVHSTEFSAIIGPLGAYLGDALGSKCTAATKDAWTKLVHVIMACLDDEK